VPEKINIPMHPETESRIIGLGIDIVASERVRRMLESRGQRFLSRCFTPSEVEFCLARPDPVPDLAVRLASKEACFKAIGGRRGMGLGWREFEVVMDSGIIPSIKLNGRAKERGKALGVEKTWLSLTHESEWSVAVVIMTGG
jgi:holo-[acyl-carrier protein] synthase